MEESKTYLKNIDLSPKKLRYYLASTKKMSPSKAADYLFYGGQKATQILYQAVKSAISNAKTTLKVNDDQLRFKLFTIEEGQKLKRYRPGSRGTPKPIVKRKSHIKIVLIADNKVKSQMSKVKSEDKKLKVKDETETKDKKSEARNPKS